MQPAIREESTMVAKQENSDVQEFNHRSMTSEDSWGQWFFFDGVHNAVLDLVDSQVNPKNIVDVGCGTGRLLRKARGRWTNASFSFLAHVTKRYPVCHKESGTVNLVINCYGMTVKMSG
jgi:SAM-dependent methyltransferase